MNTDTLWFVGAGMAIIFGGLLNLIAIDRGGSKFSKAIAVFVNSFNTAMFCFALSILNEHRYMWELQYFSLPQFSSSSC